MSTKETTMPQATTIQHDAHVGEDDDGYERFSEQLRAGFAQLQGPHETLRLFTTDAEGLFDAFLAELPADRRQHYTCRSCRTFVERFGGLVTIDGAGAQASAIWDRIQSPPLFRNAAAAVDAMVCRARVTGVFLSSERVWGTESNVSSKGVDWRHMHVVPASTALFRGTLLNAGQAMAERREDYGTLQRGLAEFPIDAVREAHRLLTVGGLYRSEKCIGVAKWLLDLHEAREATKNARLRENIVWRAVASAPPGFAHVRSTMIGTLLEDIVAGKPFDDIKRAFGAKMDPLHYQRPQAAPTDGQLAAAEKVVATLASAGSLERRFARLEDVLPRAIWTPKPAKVEAPAGGVFGHLKAAAKPMPSADIPTQTVTWEKFARTVLPDAERVEVIVPSIGPFFAFVTAANLDAPPILQWDREDSRNPVSWYLYPGGKGATAYGWGLAPGALVDVDVITLQPSEWTGHAHQSGGVYFVLRGAHDMTGGGLGLFPEILRSEYHGIRAAIEAHSRSKSLPEEKAPACGICLQKNNTAWNHVLRVTSRGGRASYRIDRID